MPLSTTATVMPRPVAPSKAHDGVMPTAGTTTSASDPARIASDQAGRTDAVTVVAGSAARSDPSLAACARALSKTRPRSAKAALDCRACAGGRGA